MKSIAFCVPVMGRIDDIKATLKHNLSVINDYQGKVKIYINCFDSDFLLKNWIDENFTKKEQVKNLVFNQCEPLIHWHFSWAKNSFKNYITEDYYSSLDGDNFLSKGEIDQLFEIINSNSEVVFHGFSGKWGDGTSGRVTIPSRLYKKYLYMDKILPRQVDEIGLLANIFSNEKEVPYIGYHGANSFQLSKGLKNWRELNKININRIEVINKNSLPPINPKSEHYTREDDVLSFYQKFNESYTYLKLSTTEESVSFYKKNLEKVVVELSAKVAEDILSKAFVSRKKHIRSDDITLYTVIKNDHVFLEKWIEHYRNIGVKRFVIIDDYSIPSLDLSLKGDDIFIFKPLIGDFKTCKVLWMNLLLKVLQKDNSWVLTVDSDEFICLDEIADNLNIYCEYLSKNNRKFSSGLLIDMLPNEKADIENMSSSDFMDIFTDCYLRPYEDDFIYQNIKSIKWAFNNHWSYSHRIDARWRFFQTIDSLRKFPIVKYQHGIKLNQGFHAINIEGKDVSAKWAFESSKYILPIKHYKFVSLFHKHMQKKTFDAYHERTKENLTKIASKDIYELKKEIDISPFVNKFEIDKFRNNLFFKKNGLYRIIGNNLPGLHSRDQNIQNLNHILEFESKFYNIDKVFVLNRLISKKEINDIVDILKEKKYNYHIIDFNLNNFLCTNYALDRLPTSSFWFSKKSKWEETCCEVAIRENKNKYLMNNNGARNFCLEKGRTIYDWVFPWDGNCFLSDSQYKEINNIMNSNSKNKYIAVPMERVVDNLHINRHSISLNHTEEPQIIFKKSTVELFNGNRVYGNQPKVELFKRLGYQGKWDDWKKLYPWEEIKFEKSKDAGTVVEKSSVFRLFSGNMKASIDASNRAETRFNSIVQFIDSIEIDYMKSVFSFESISRIVKNYLKLEVLNDKQVDMLCYGNRKNQYFVSFDKIKELYNIDDSIDVYDIFLLFSSLESNKESLEILDNLYNNHLPKLNRDDFLSGMYLSYLKFNIAGFVRSILSLDFNLAIKFKIEIIMIFYYLFDNSKDLTDDLNGLLILSVDLFNNVCNYDLKKNLESVCNNYKFNEINI